MADIKNFPELRKLNPTQKASLITFIVQYERLELVKEAFEDQWKRPISLRTIQEVEETNAEAIADLKQQVMQQLAAVPMSQRHKRLKRLEYIWRLSKKKKTRYSIKISKDDYEEFKGPDIKMMRQVVMDAETIMCNAEKLEIERQKAFGGGGLGDEEDTEDGIEWPDEDQGIA